MQYNHQNDLDRIDQKPVSVQQPDLVSHKHKPWNEFCTDRFKDAVKVRHDYGDCQTGYPNLDSEQRMYPGLYILGAASSLGKTTFIHQMADQMAASGRHVLYFSLEQTCDELYSKSIARGCAKSQAEDYHYPTPDSIQIRFGLTEDCQAQVDEQMDAYTRLNGGRMHIVHDHFGMAVEDITRIVQEFTEQIHEKPVVVVDYLQIIAPSAADENAAADRRSRTDHAVCSLKSMQMNYDLIVILISAVNRQNYTSPIDFESFKESGGIEYTGDVVWGMQLSILTNYELYSTGTGTKRSELLKAKSANPRKIDLVCLKNRYGQIGYTVSFEYYPASDYFVPVQNDDAADPNG